MCLLFFFLMIRRPPRSTLDRSSAASDVYKRQALKLSGIDKDFKSDDPAAKIERDPKTGEPTGILRLSLIHISEPTRPY